MYPDDRSYTTDHEWVRAEGDVCTIGITSFATEQLGDVTYVELPEVGTLFESGDEAATVESVKAASDIYAPVGGEVVEINSSLDDQPERVNENPFEAGWFFKLKNVDISELDALMDAAAYRKFVEGLEE